MSGLPSLTTAHRLRLARLLGMVGSDHDGEALNAARLADRLVRDAGVTWEAVLLGVEISTPPAGRAPRAPRAPRQPRDAGATLDATLVGQCLQGSAPWEAWQLEFLYGFAERLGRGQALSEKQRKVLAGFVSFAKLYAREAA